MQTVTATTCISVFMPGCSIENSGLERSTEPFNTVLENVLGDFSSSSKDEFFGNPGINSEDVTHDNENANELHEKTVTNSFIFEKDLLALLEECCGLVQSGEDALRPHKMFVQNEGRVVTRGGRGFFEPGYRNSAHVQDMLNANAEAGQGKLLHSMVTLLEQYGLFTGEMDNLISLQELTAVLESKALTMQANTHEAAGGGLPWSSSDGSSQGNKAVLNLLKNIIAQKSLAVQGNNTAVRGQTGTGGPAIIPETQPGTMAALSGHISGSQTSGSDFLNAFFVKTGSTTSEELLQKLEGLKVTSTRPLTGFSVEKTDAGLLLDQQLQQDTTGQGGNGKASLYNWNVSGGEGCVNTAQLSGSMSADGFITTGEPSVQTGFLEQVTDRIHIALHRGQNRVTIQLNPPSLGRIHVNLSMKSNQLRAVIITENAAVKNMLEANSAVLKEALGSHDIDLKSFSVQVGEDSPQEETAHYLDRKFRHPDRKNPVISAGCSVTPGLEDDGEGISPARLQHRNGLVNIFA